MGSSRDLNWEALRFPTCDLINLGDAFSEEEVLSAIKSMPSDKASGPDGFTGAFFKSCWPTIKNDVMNVVQQFSDLRTGSFHWLNSANIALLPKKEGVEEIFDYRPISLIHAMAKIIAKMTSLRLAPHMDTLVSKSQSAFIKGRGIHYNFMCVRNYVRRMHRTNTPTILLKLDIKKAFDSVRWSFLLDLLQNLGFPAKFRNWVAALLVTASSRVMLNGVPGLPIIHGGALGKVIPSLRCFLTS